LKSALIESELGPFRAQFTETGLARLQFPRAKEAPVADAIDPPVKWLRQTTSALHTMLQGKTPRTLPPLDLSAGTAFRQAVWNLLLAIPGGTVQTYGELAHQFNQPKAARAVGGACGANPIPLIVPCHRVIGANGSLTGYSGGMKWKIRLLRIEGIELPLH
tara:strand:+ start:112 stop:594 length:483 start_codon:yes stop_codon:yes gene_type:complete